MNTDLKLYQSSGSPNSRRVRIFLAEKHIDVIQVSVNLGVRNRVPGLKGRAIAGPHGYEQIPGLVGRGMERIRDCA